MTYIRTGLHGLATAIALSCLIEFIQGVQAPGSFIMFRFNNHSPITFNDDLPADVDVVIIGAGVIGVCTAWNLQQRGLSVLVCDKGRVAGEQSSRNWGWVRSTGRGPGRGNDRHGRHQRLGRPAGPVG